MYFKKVKNMSDLNKLRAKINEIDEKMLDLFKERMNCAKDVALYKKENNIAIFDPKREQEVILKNSEKLNNPELLSEYKNFIQALMDSSKLYQRKIVYGETVGYQGVEGAFSNICANELFKGANFKAFNSFNDVLTAIEKEEIEVGVLPIENSTNGEVGEVMDGLFKHGDLFINAYYDLKVDQNLVVIPGTRIEDIEHVYSHSQAIGQCSTFLKSRKFEVHQYSNTAKAAEYVKQMGLKSIAAIASKKTAELYGLEVLGENINNSDLNTTRFALVSKRYSTNGNKFGLFFTVKNEAGSLAKAVEIISNTGMNMTCLRSRSMKDLPWEYYFYSEIDGDINDDKSKKMLDELKMVCLSVRVLGSYQKL